VAQLYDPATVRILPHRLEPIAAAYVAVLKDLAAGAGSAFDLASTLKLATALEEAAGRFDRAPKAAFPLLARVKDLSTLSRDDDALGFLDTQMIRGRNEVESKLRAATEAIDGYLSRKR
jgi:hypothetical protein